MCVCVHVWWREHKKDIIQSIHGQTVQLPRLVHGDLIKSDICWRVRWQITLLASPHICCAPVSLHCTALPRTVMISPEVQWHQVCNTDVFVNTKVAAWTPFTSLTHTVNTPHTHQSQVSEEHRTKEGLALLCSCGYFIISSGMALCRNVGVWCWVFTKYTRFLWLHLWRQGLSWRSRSRAVTLYPVSTTGLLSLGTNFQFVKLSQTVTFRIQFGQS